MARRRALMLIDSLPLSMVAADIAAFWGVNVNGLTFYCRDVADVVAEFDGLSHHDKAMLEWAILDNVNGYCAWTPQRQQNLISAARWPQQRPDYLNPLRYRSPDLSRRTPRKS